MSALDRVEALRAQSFILMTRADDIALKANGSMGEVILQEQIYRPLLEVMAQNAYSPKTLGELVDHKKLQGLAFEQVVAALLVLTGIGHAHPAQPVTKQARERCAALNRYICERTRSSTDIAALASPVTGSGVTVERFHQLFLLALQDGKKTIADQAAFVWEVLSAQGQRLVKNGEAIPTAEQNLAELTQHATQFAEVRLPLLKALGVA